MKQLAQNLRTGKTVLLEVPAPLVKKGHVLIKTRKSLVSTGTEKMLIGFGKASILEKARLQSDKIKPILNKIKCDGLLPTARSVLQRLDQLIPLGYCNVGDVMEVGEDVAHFRRGDRVVSNGLHAEMVCVPANLVAKVPDDVTDEEAAFTVIAAVALQGIRLLGPALGETVVVIGLGLTGLLTAEMLKANGCRVIGLEPDEQKLQIASEKGIITINPRHTDPEKLVADLTDGAGADGIIITASSASHDLISLAAKIARKRSKVILTGAVGLNLRREDFYKRELTLQVSCSYGPGRYDPNYEEKGLDYPIPFVRWTANRNFEAVMDMLASGLLNVKPLITEVIPLVNFWKVYDQIVDSKGIAYLFHYPQTSGYKNTIRFQNKVIKAVNGTIGIVGAGNYTRMTMLPLLKDFAVKYIASENGFSAAELATKYRIPYITTDFGEMLSDEEVSLVIVATRHDKHAAMVIQALNAGKHVFVEKPLALLPEQLEAIIEAWQTREHDVSLTVGFNRRFSSHTLKIKELLGNAAMNVVVTVNAGYIPAESWVHDPQIGGGRIVGEGCHFIDLISFLTGSSVTAVCMNTMGGSGNGMQDNANILLRYQNGSTGAINYFSNGHPAFPKERVEVHSLGKTLVLDNFITLTGYGFKHFTRYKSRQDKGHERQFRQLREMVCNGGPALIPFGEIVNTTRATFAAMESLKNTCWESVE
ncbi:bi-domain-containing oxidoreductase [Dyadobacter pollutisoli]|jgi:predicted dehydrogenase|uniref:Bi-domain-containing oxidoreductase n=1 Tax=Dyadobacter pollutisoli TaxID=2910158 RepID=A0A9E8NBC4_9BACT|nr:bi-domain-containing oxidoreductase [Dyadobacter pollutisoli]WAC11262.1 bi-domain-containing oxidoreductase [Dyadobacter pollutisoli]